MRNIPITLYSLGYSFIGYILNSLYMNIRFLFRSRDVNLPNFVFEDVPLFLGLIRDLFPGLECPRVGYPDFSAAVETALAEQGYVVLPAQVRFGVA
jgi:hypothetical protein